MIQLRLISCFACLGAAGAIFLLGIFQQSGVMHSGFSAPLLFVLDIGFFALATYQGALIHDRVVCNRQQE